MEKRAIRINTILTLFLLMFFMFFVSCFSVFGALNVDTIARNSMNYGDKFVVSGNINLDIDARAFLYLSLVCEDNRDNIEDNAVVKSIKSSALATTFMDLKKDESFGFSQLVTIPNNIFNVFNSDNSDNSGNLGLYGNCNIQAKIVSGSEILENVNSNTFTVTNDLTGSFDASVKNDVQLGDTFSLTGAVVKADKTGVDGTSVVSFKQEDAGVVFFENIDVKGGQVSYKKDLSLIPAGSYTIDVKVQDNLGNSHEYLSIASFKVSDKLIIDSRVDKNIYSPGETVVLGGDIKPFSTGSLVENIEVEADFDGVKLKDNLPDVKFPFSIKYNVPSDMKSGDHIIRVVVKDNKGNFGSSITKFAVKSVPRVLNVVLDKSGHIPNENIVFKVRLTDQANDNYDDSIMVKMYNEKGEFEKSKLVSSNGFDFFIVPRMALPGTWKISAEGFGLNSEKNFIVLPSKKVETSITDGVLYVKNIGNIRYDDYIDVQIGDKIRGRKIALGLNETAQVKLNTLFEPNVYDVISIPTTGQNFTLIKVPEESSFFSGFADITGNAVNNLKSGSNGIWFVGLFLMIVVGLVLLFKPKEKSDYTEQQRAKDVRDGQKMLEQLRAKGIRKSPAHYGFGVANDADRKDFAVRMAKQVESEQERIAKESFSRKWSGEAKDVHNYSNSGAFEVKKEEPKKEENSGFGGGMINW